jgi:hypothetical protein
MTEAANSSQMSNTFIVQLMHTTLKNVQLLKYFKNKGGCSNMFRFTMIPSSGSHSQYLTKITYLVQCEYMEVVQTLSVLWLHSMTCAVCVLCTVWAYTLTHCTVQVILCSHNTDNVCTTSMYSQWTKYVILAKYCLWLPDDGFIVNRNMLEQPPLFLKCSNNSFLTLCALVGQYKCLISLMHGCNHEDPLKCCYNFISSDSATCHKIIS